MKQAGAGAMKKAVMPNAGEFLFFMFVVDEFDVDREGDGDRTATTSTSTLKLIRRS